MGRDGSDWDYINENMGGHDEDGLPNFMSKPGFSDAEYIIKEEHHYFDTFQKAMAWGKNNPGQAIIRAPDGKGYILKKKEESYRLSDRKGKFALSPMLYELYTGSPPRVSFERNKFIMEVKVLSQEKIDLLKAEIVEGLKSAQSIYSTAVYYNKNVKRVSSSEIAQHEEWRDTMQVALDIISKS